MNKNVGLAIKKEIQTRTLLNLESNKIKFQGSRCKLTRTITLQFSKDSDDYVVITFTADSQLKDHSVQSFTKGELREILENLLLSQSVEKPSELLFGRRLPYEKEDILLLLSKLINSEIAH